ncbi:hypothetical protein [Actinomadura sp. CNU-125]|uniref:hypothetical protein n=1 Tax=Actinomadura sp. CNU-125 TaxID=1904961 RepID=UPI0021CD1614|nr:hypothetical protein [Actinomadura sp. CNU-125]
MQWSTREDWSLQIEAFIPEDAGPGWSDAMAALGWHPSDSSDTDGLVIGRFPNAGAEEATTAARMLVGALRSYGVAFVDLWYQLISPDMFLLGIGLPPGTANASDQLSKFPQNRQRRPHPRLRLAVAARVRPSALVD